MTTFRTGVLVLVICLFAAVPATAANRSDFQYFARVTGDLRPGEPSVLNLTEEIVVRTSPSLTDLRVFDQSGIEIPYVVRPEVTAGTKAESFAFKILDFHDSKLGISTYLERPEGVTSFDQLEILTPNRDFKKKVQVSSSPGGISWGGQYSDVGEGTIFDFTSQVDLRRTTIELPVVRDRYLSVRITDDSPVSPDGKPIHLKYDGLEFSVGGASKPPFRIDAVRGNGGRAMEEKPVFETKTIANPPSSVDANKVSVYKLGWIRIPVEKIALRIANQYYCRRVEVWGGDTEKDDEWRMLASGQAFNLPGMAAPECTVALPTGAFSRYLKIVIVNEDNPPLTVQSLDLSWRRLNLFFIPEVERSYNLVFGGKDIPAPRYDIARIIADEPAKVPSMPRCMAGAIQQNPGYDPELSLPAKEKRERTILRLVVLILIGALGFWLYRLLRKLPATTT